MQISLIKEKCIIFGFEQRLSCSILGSYAIFNYLNNRKLIQYIVKLCGVKSTPFLASQLIKKKFMPFTRLK